MITQRPADDPGEPNPPKTAMERHARSPIIALPRDLLNVKTAIPLYYRLASVIQEMVDSSVLRPGDQLPPDEQIAAHLNVARNTVRQAIDQLVRTGTLRRKHGIGTFINPETDEVEAVRGRRQIIRLKPRPHLPEPHIRPPRPRRRPPPDNDNQASGPARGATDTE